MSATKGAGLASAATDSEARKIARTGERDRQSSKPPFQHVQVARRDIPVLCPVCERKVARQSRQQKFCSKRCAEKGRLRSRKSVLGQGTGVPADPPKNSRQINDLQRAKTRSMTGIIGPRSVIHAELLAGREWQETVSAGGVTGYVSRIARRALVVDVSP